jgi:hypothetical protein
MSCKSHPGGRRFERRSLRSSKRTAAVVALAVAVLLMAAPAAAYDAPTRLNEVAHVYSLGVGEVRCPSEPEWNADPYSTSFGWGYTNVRRDYSVLPPMICAGAMNVGSSSVPAWQQAAGVWMLVHEAFHLRHWRFRRDEAKVGCQTIVYFTDAAALLGASEGQAQQLYPYALALHDLELALYPWHRDPKCIVPPWILPSAPEPVKHLEYFCEGGANGFSARKDRFEQRERRRTSRSNRKRPVAGQLLVN